MSSFSSNGSAGGSQMSTSSSGGGAPPPPRPQRPMHGSFGYFVERRAQSPPPSMPSRTSTNESMNSQRPLPNPSTYNRPLPPVKTSGNNKAFIASRPMGLGDEEMERNKVLNELIATEKSYVEDLNLAITKYLGPLRKKNLLPEVELAKLFSNIEILYRVNEELLNKLEQRKRTNPSITPIGDIFLESKDVLSNSYVAFCNDQMEALKIYDQCKKKSNIAAFLKEVKEDPQCRSLELIDFLMKPMQRICKYPLLLKELYKYTGAQHPDYSNLSAALEAFSNILSTINATSRESENLRKIIEIENSLVGAEGLKLMVGNRKFIRGGLLKKIYKNRIQPRQFWLFSDLLLYAKPHLLNKNLFDYKGLIPVDKLIVKDCDDSEVKHGFSLSRTDRENKTYIISAPNSETKMLWLASLKDAMEGKVKPEDTTTVAFKLKQEGSEENTKNHLRILEIYDSIEAVEKIPSNAARKFLYEGPLNVIQKNKEGGCEKSTPLYFFLFDDFIVYTEIQAKKKKYLWKGLLPLDKLLVVSQDDQIDVVNHFDLIRYDTKKVLTVSANSEEEKEEWINLLDSKIDENLQKEKEEFMKDANFKDIVKASRKSYRFVEETGPPERRVQQKQMLSELQKVLSPEVIFDTPAPPQGSESPRSSVRPAPPSSGKNLSRSNTSLSFRFNRSSMGNVEQLSGEVKTRMDEVQKLLKNVNWKSKTRFEVDELSQILSDTILTLSLLKDKLSTQ